MSSQRRVDRWTAPRVDLRRLEYFLAVVDEGGVARAEDVLFVAQPSLSQAIKTLERELGATLFTRSGRRLVLTAAGRALVGPARQLVADAASARRAARRVIELAGGWIDVVALPTLAADPLADLAGRFRRRYPRIGLDVHDAVDAGEVAARVLGGECEFGLTTPLPSGRDDLRHCELAAKRFEVVAPPGTSSLDGLGWVTTPPGSPTRVLLVETLAERGVEPDIAVETDDWEAIVALVVSGAGVALLPRPMAEQAVLHGARLWRRDPPIVRRVGLVYRPGPLSPPAAAFLATARFVT